MKIKVFVFVAIFSMAFLGIGEVAKASCLEQNFAQKTDIEKIQCLTSAIADLTQQIAQLQAQKQISSCHDFNSNLGFANSGSGEVAKLHEILKKENISYGDDTENEYTQATADAVEQLQKKYGVLQTGYVGQLTRAKLNDLYGCDVTPPQTTSTCVDSDEGVNYGVKGTTTLGNDSHTDVCISQGIAEECSGTNCRVNEYYCLKPWSIGSIMMDCPNGCKDGACKSSNSNCTANWQCTDWDKSYCWNLGYQARNCIDTNKCGEIIDRPPLTQSCITDTTCVPAWNCAPWGTCASNSNTQTRICTDTNFCNVLTDRPPLTRTCECDSNWSCTDWNTCINGSQSRTCTDTNNCAKPTDLPVLTQTCGGTACVPAWDCEPWSACRYDNTQTRMCTDTNHCELINEQPALTRACNCDPNWQCNAWSTCSNNIQTRTCTDVNNCGVEVYKPAESQTCGCPRVLCFSDRCPGRHLPDANGCVNCSSPCP